MKCPKCDQEYDDSFKFCPNCGKPRKPEQRPARRPPPQRVKKRPLTPEESAQVREVSKTFGAKAAKALRAELEASSGSRQVRPSVAPPPLPPQTTSPRLQPSDNNKGGFKKFWADLPPFARVLLIGGPALLIIIGVIVGVVGHYNSTGVVNEGVAGTYKLERMTLELKDDGTYTSSVEPMGEYDSGTWEATSYSVSVKSEKLGTLTGTWEIEGSNLRDSDGEVWERQ